MARKSTQMASAAAKPNSNEMSFAFIFRLALCGMAIRLSGNLEPHLFGALVLPQAKEGGMTHDAIGGPRAKFHFGDQFGCDEANAARFRSGKFLGGGTRGCTLTGKAHRAAWA